MLTTLKSMSVIILSCKFCYKYVLKVGGTMLSCIFPGNIAWSTTINPLTPISDQNRISLYNINTISSRQVMRTKKNNQWDHLLIQYQILLNNITWILWQTVRRINNEILGVKGLSKIYLISWQVCWRRQWNRERKKRCRSVWLWSVFFFEDKI